jgi:hypothetical protein
MRIFRTIILLSGAAVLLPSPPESDSQAAAQQISVHAVPGLIETAAQTVSDVAGFCARQPGVCQTAGYIAHTVEAKAKYSVKLIYEWANESSAGPDAPVSVEEAKSDPISTSSMSFAALTAPRNGQSTLKIGDLIPAWRGPVAAKKG